MNDSSSGSDIQPHATQREQKLPRGFAKYLGSKADQVGAAHRSGGTSSLQRIKNVLKPRDGEHKTPHPTAKSDPETSNNSPNRSNYDHPTRAATAETAAVDQHEDNDMWKRAEEKLRRDPDKRKKLEDYDEILERHFQSKLEPFGTVERRQQFRGFLDSELQKLNDEDSDTKLSRCSNKAKRFFKSAATRIVDVKDIIGTATNTCLPASIACTGVVVLLSFCLQAAEQRHVFFDGLNTISGSVCRIAEYESLVGRDSFQRTEEFDDLVTIACCNIIEFQARAACYLQCNRLESQIRNMFKWDGWSELLEAIKQAEERIKEYAERKSLENICSVIEKFDELDKKLSDGVSRLAETQAAIDRRKRADAFLKLLYDNTCPYKDRKNINRERSTGTCDWFTDHDLFKTWNLPKESNRDTRSLLYVTADPGCGKSVLSKYLVDEILPDDGRATCYFFFKDGFGDQKSSKGALCAILHQLFTINRNLLTDTILDCHGAHGEKFVESFEELWNTFTSAARYQEVVCVFDALDECREVDRKELINAITNARGSSLKFLLTSRPYEHIRRQVSDGIKSEMASIHLQGDRGAAADAIEQEIQLVMESRINDVVRDFRLQPDEHELMMKQMKSIPNRTYLWITLVFDGLMKVVDITKRDIMNMTKQLPEGISDTYERILARTKGKDKVKAEKLLHFVLAAKRPLTLLEVTVALALDGQHSWEEVEDDIIPKSRIEDIIRNLCGLFIIIVDEKIYLLHQTAREFLVCSDPISKSEETNNLVEIECSPQPITMAANLISWFNTVQLYVLLKFICQIIFSTIYKIDGRAIDLEGSGPQEDKSKSSKYLARPDYCSDLPRQEFDKAPQLWKHSMVLADSNVALAEACISYLEFQFPLPNENVSLLEYAAQFWADHYRDSRDDYKLHVGERTKDLCLQFAKRSEWPGFHVDCTTLEFSSPLCLASALGLDRAVDIFIREQSLAGLDLADEVELRGDNGRAPLSWAAGNGHETVVKLLLQVHDNVNLKDKNGWTPLMWAAGNGHEAVVKLLLQAHADVDSKDYRGLTPFMYAAMNGRETEVKQLLQAHAGVDSKDENDRTPLMWAAMNGRETVVKLLLQLHVDIESKDYNGLTPLSWAARNGREAVVKLLLQAHADVESKDEDGMTPLSYAVEHGHTAVVNLLKS